MFCWKQAQPRSKHVKSSVLSVIKLKGLCATTNPDYTKHMISALKIHSKPLFSTRNNTGTRNCASKQQIEISKKTNCDCRNSTLGNIKCNKTPVQERRVKIQSGQTNDGLQSCSRI